MQNSKRFFIIILCLLALLLIAFKLDSIVQPSMEVNYHVSIITYIDKYLKEYQHLVGHEIEIAQIEGLPISEIETKVNDTIYHATLSWISGKVLYDLPNNTSINLQSNRYLSITNFFPNYGDNHFLEWGIWDYITIDVSTGERIFLEDLVEICDEFIYLIKTEKIAYAENFEYTLSDEGRFRAFFQAFR